MAVRTSWTVATGPLFDGLAEAAAQRYTVAINTELADIGADWIRIDAEAFDRSGRGGTGRASEGVKRRGAGDDQVIYGGINEGQYAWPWLEGTSRRNSDTRFKGYHEFRKTRFRLAAKAVPYAQEKLREYLPEMGDH